jgi:hypothetical protein
MGEMKLRRHLSLRLLLSGLVLGLACSPRAMSQPAQDTQSSELPTKPKAKGEWRKAESDNFVVYSNTGQKQTEAYALKLEQYRYVLNALNNRTGDNLLPSPKLDIYFVKSTKDLRQVLPKMSEDVLGFVLRCDSAMAGFSLYDGDMVDNRKVKYQAQNTSQTVIFHEYAHLYMFQNSQTPYPKWFIEGYAEFYGTTRIQGDQALVGMAWDQRSGELINGMTELRYEDILRNSDIINWSNFYAQSWLLAHYILSDQDRRKAFVQFLNTQNPNEDAVITFEKAFGFPVKELKKRLNGYLMKDIKASVFRLKDMPAPKITSTALPLVANRLLMYDAASKTCTKDTYQSDLLAKIRTEAAKTPEDAYAKRVLMDAEIMLGDEALALPFYLTYTQMNPNDAEGFYRLGQTLYLMSKHNKFADNDTLDSQMKKARVALGKSYKLDPLNPFNLYLLSQTEKRGPDFPNASTLNAAYEAHLLAPSVPEFALNAANMLIIKDRIPEARTVLAPLANTPHDEKMANWISEIIALIDAKASKDEIIKKMRATPPKD